MKKVLFVALSALYVNANAGRPLMSGDVIGRDLTFPTLGYFGHVGMGTGDDIGLPTQTILEVLNQAPKPIIVFNSQADFRSRDVYWGSRYGFAGYGSTTRAALVEGNHQRMWCPKYTITGQYTIGSGNIQTGQPYRCAEFRCDTFVAYIFQYAGLPQLMNLYPLIPRSVWASFPYFNGDLFASDTKAPELTSIDKQFTEMDIEEINHMSFMDFAQFVDTPIVQTTPTHIAREWELVENENVKPILRGAFLDRLAKMEEPNTISRFLKIYNTTNEPEVKSKVIEGVETVYQTRPETISQSEKQELKVFYVTQLQRKLRDRDTDKIIRGYVDLHTTKDIESNLDAINSKLNGIEPTLKLGLQLQLSRRSKALESIYVPLIIKDLKEQQSSSLDDMFFTIASMSKDSFSPESVKQIKSYIDYRSAKYSQTLAPNALGPNNDAYFGVAKHSYDDAVKAFR